MTNNKKDIIIYKELISGSVAGLASRLVVSPFDVLKIRYQLQTGDVVSSSSADLRYRGIISSWRRIIREEGNLSAAYLYMGYGAVQFASYKYISLYAEKYSSKNTSLVKGISGGLAGTFATFVTYPFDLMRTRFAAQGKDRVYKSFFGAFRKMYAQEGVFGFYRGLSASLVQIFPYMAILFASYDFFKHRVPKQLKNQQDLIAGGLAGAIGKLSVMPLDVQGPTREKYIIETAKYPKHSSLFEIATKIIKTEGFLGLYRGAVPSILKAIPSTAVTFSVYNFINKILQ